MENSDMQMEMKIKNAELVKENARLKELYENECKKTRKLEDDIWSLKFHSNLLNQTIETYESKLFYIAKIVKETISETYENSFLYISKILKE
jgi:hypothetical protein